MATIEEREGKKVAVLYRVKVRLKGAPAQTATFERKIDARIWAESIEAAIREGRHFTEAKRHTLGEMIDRYNREVLCHKSDSMQRDQSWHLAWWKDQLGDKSLADVTSALISEYRDKLMREIGGKGKPRSPSTAVRYLSALSHVYTIAIKDWQWVDHSPLWRVTKPAEPRGRVRCLSEDERERLMNACIKSGNQSLYTLVVLALSTGARRGEILALTWSDVAFDRGVAILPETKNGRRRVLPLTGRALMSLKELSKARHIGADLIFYDTENKRPWEPRSAWDRVVKQAGIDDFRFHDLRHSAASYLAMSGATPAEIAAILGHNKLQMVKRYSHLSDLHTAGIVAKMNHRIFG